MSYSCMLLDPFVLGFLGLLRFGFPVYKFPIAVLPCVAVGRSLTGAGRADDHSDQDKKDGCELIFHVFVCFECDGIGL